MYEIQYKIEKRVKLIRHIQVHWSGLHRISLTRRRETYIGKLLDILDAT